MKAIQFSFILLINCIGLEGNSQTKDFYIKDIFYPELKGAVKSFTEFIISGNDTLRVLKISYSKSGIRTSQYTRTSHPEMRFKNDSTCYKVKEKEVYSVNCKNDSITNTKMSIDDKGLIIEVDETYPDQEISYVPYYDDAGHLTSIYTARTKDKKYQFIATLLYTLNADGSIKESSAEGGDQPQGKTKYIYNDKKLLIKTTRSGFDGNKVFQIEFSGHDQKGNWTTSRYQNGIIVIQVFEYY